MASTRINILSLCSGLGGLELGIHAATGGRASVVAYVEREAFAAACLLARMEEEESALESAPVWCGNLQDFPAESFYGLVDGITAGYPCQPFSLAGKRKGSEDERHIFPDILRIIESVDPVFCFFENVPGHLSSGFSGVYQSLASLGFLVEAGIYSAEEVGAPHRRERLFILAHKGRDFLRLQPWRGCWQSGEVKVESGVSGQSMGDTNSSRWEATRIGWIEFSGQEPKAGGGDVADSHDSGQRTNPRPIQGHRGDNSGWGINAMDDTEGQGLEERRQGRIKQKNPRPFPPGPNGDWSKIPEWLQPAMSESGIRRVANGIPRRLGNPMACRPDKLRALGNSVVPAVAEKAFRSLVQLAKKGNV